MKRYKKNLKDFISTIDQKYLTVKRNKLMESKKKNI